MVFLGMGDCVVELSGCSLMEIAENNYKALHTQRCLQPAKSSKSNECAMKILTIFNNKGGVGKTTLTYHLAHALAEKGRRVLLIDLDPQCNLTITALDMGQIHDVWEPEDPYIEDFSGSSNNLQEMIAQPRSIHFLLKPTEDGIDDLDQLPPPTNLEIIYRLFQEGLHFTALNRR